MDVSNFFFCSGEGKGESKAPGGWGGGSFFQIENPRRGGGAPRREEGGRPRGREGVCGDFFFVVRVVCNGAGPILLTPRSGRKLVY